MRGAHYPGEPEIGAIRIILVDVTGSQWIGLFVLVLGLAGSAYYVYLLWNRRVLRKRGVEATGRVVSVTATKSVGQSVTLGSSKVEFVDASDTTRRFKRLGMLDVGEEVGVSYDPKKPTRVRVTTRPSHPAWSSRRQLLLIYPLSHSLRLVPFAGLLMSGLLFMTGLAEYSDDQLASTRGTASESQLFEYPGQLREIDDEFFPDIAKVLVELSGLQPSDEPGLSPDVMRSYAQRYRAVGAEAEASQPEETGSANLAIAREVFLQIVENRVETADLALGVLQEGGPPELTVRFVELIDEERVRLSKRFNEAVEAYEAE